MLAQRLSRDQLPADAAQLARFLLGRLIVRQIGEELLAGRIVETEAYLPGDAAAHSFIGRTARNNSLFLERGHAYVYRSYGIHWALNVSAESEGVGAGVLLRAIEPVHGIASMRRNRGAPVPDRDLARGPGRLAAALAVDRSLDGVDLCADHRLWLAEGAAPASTGVSTRIGITKEAHRPLRFFVAGSRFVSGPGWLNRV
ncbi:MAG TPA: DNA-3-methyladenine glycosylase [Acetobacteraceae bacterium]|nr:DNA-3-methyladenine glycosylase [Acetobacteraceae bacterium]